MDQATRKIAYLRESILDKDIDLKNKKKEKMVVKEYSPRVDTSKENPVVTQEKWKERTLHRAVLLGNIFKFSLVNYYKLNHYLKDLTSNKLYYQPFIDKKNINKQLIYARKELFFSIKDKVVRKDDLQLIKLILKKIKDNDRLLKETHKQENNDLSFFSKLLNFIVIEKKDKFFFKFVIKIFKIDEKNILKKREKLNIEKFLRKVGKNILTNKTSTLEDSKNSIINRDNLKEVKKEPYVTSPRYVKRNEIEKIDNIATFNSVKKYNEERTKVNWKKEFSDSFVLKEKKGNLNTNNGPDLSRRNKN